MWESALGTLFWLSISTHNFSDICTAMQRRSWSRDLQRHVRERTSLHSLCISYLSCRAFLDAISLLHLLSHRSGHGGSRTCRNDQGDRIARNLSLTCQTWGRFQFGAVGTSVIAHFWLRIARFSRHRYHLWPRRNLLGQIRRNAMK